MRAWPVSILFRAVLWMGGGVVILGLLSGSVNAQDRAPADAALGRPIVRTISPQAYNGNGEVWDIAQDARGLLYIASSYGLQQYDGARWRALDTGNRTTPWSIARDSAGTLYVGARDELGTYRPDSLGRLRYHSLLKTVSETHRPVGHVRDVVAAQDAIFFRTETGVLRWDGDRMEAVTDTTARGLYTCRDTAYVHSRDGRLWRMDGANRRLVRGSQLLRDASIASVIPMEGAGCRMVAREQGWFAVTSSGVQSRPMPGGALGVPIEDAVRGAEGALAVATASTLRLIGPYGKKRRVTRSSLPEGNITELYVSRRQALWVATTSGIARVAWPDPASVVMTPSSLQGGIDAVTRHEGRLFVGTRDGLWRGGAGTFEQVGPAGNVFNLLSTRSGLLIAANEGLFRVRGERVRRLTDASAYVLHRSRRDSSVVYVGLYGDGILRLQRRGGQWRIADRTDRTDTPIYTVAQDRSGRLWLGTGHRGILRLDPPLAPLDEAPIVRFDTSDGLPAPTVNYTAQLGDSVRFTTQDGLYRFTGTAFTRDQRFAPVYADGVRLGWPAVAGENDEVWIDFGGHKFGVVDHWASDSLRWTDRPFRRLADIGDVSAIYTDSGRHSSGRTDSSRDSLDRTDGGRESLVWLGAENALVRYDRRLQEFGGHTQPFRTLIRGVSTRDDSLLYGGDADTTALPAAVDYAHNALRFQFGATSFEQTDGPTHNWDRPRQYRWRLEGFDEGWTPWTTETHADYTGLSPGPYTMRVQARNLYGVLGREAQVSFTILSPWYRTWWAYGLYGLLALGVVGGAVQWRTRWLRRRQKELETTVVERTKELREKNERLAEQAEKLKELDAAKDRFFANVSHEFRTPLTLIRGPVHEVREALQRENIEPREQADQLAVAERNSARLQRLIDQILGLARMDAGTYELAARPTDLGAAAGRIARTFEPLADRHGVTLAVDLEENFSETEPVYVDSKAFEHILSNVLSNAVKFTPEGGRVNLAVRNEEDGAAVIVRDTGSGIPADEQEMIFDRFQRGEKAPAREQEGIGIGLAFVNDLVELHGGAISVDSTEGEGTAFTVRLPRGREHLADEQLADDTSTSEAAVAEISASLSEFASFHDLQSSSSASDGALSSDVPSTSVDKSTIQTPQSKLVLVVDDNADVRQYVRSVLTPEFHVVEAADGKEGIDRVQEGLPDCILADVMMPEMDGVAMVRQLKQNRTTDCIPVVMLTARTGPKNEVEGLEAGADDYVTKPFDPDVLRARITGMIHVRQRLRRRVQEELRHRGDRQAGDGTAGSVPDASGDQSAGSDRPPELVVPTPTEDESSFVRDVRTAIEEHLADPDLSVEQLAGEVAVSRSTLYRRLKDEESVTPSQFIRQVRVEHGARLLDEKEGTISEVAYAVGFNSLSHFSRSFRDHFDQSPSAYVEGA